MLDKQYPTVHSKGLNKDRLFQDKEDVTFALNAIRINHEGGRIEYQSEPGNELSASLPSGYLLVGSIYGQNEEVYLFSTNSTNSEIGIFKNDKYTTLVNSDCLDFNLEHPITGEYRVRNGCERTIYWCDHFNSDYWYNIDDPDSFKTAGVFDCNKFKHVPVLLPIKTDLIGVNDTGGILPLGSYYFQPEYLDENQNLIYSGEITPQVIVYDENQNIDYYKIDGGLNIEQYDPAIGGVPITSKSITLRFYNLNTSVKYLRVNVFRSINGTQAIDGHSVATLIEVSSDSIDWTYQGYNVSAGDAPIDVSEKLVDNTVYESAYVSEQVQGRYLRANLKQSIRDYSTYQSFVSKITSKWVAKTVEMNNVKYVGNPKNPQTYWIGRGFQGDEIYLPGIQFLHNSGQWSPIFPIVGRSATATDLEILTVVPNNAVLGPLDVWLSDVEHLGLDINAQVPRWKVFNTASITSSQTAVLPKTYEGEFSYYESEETYPDVRDCDDNLLWGNDADDNPITTSTKVRLVKFPDRRLVNHVDGEWAIPFGIKFDNIQYPDSSVIGHRFVFADRTEFDKTVVDSGWAVTPFSRTSPDQITLGYGAFGVDDNYKHFNYPSNNIGSHYLRFNSAKTLFDKSASNVSYYKTNRVNKFESGTAGTNAPFDYARVDLDNGFRFYSVISRLVWTDDALPVRTNHTEQQTVLVEPGGTVPTQGLLPTIVSHDRYTGDSISYVNYGLEDTTPLLGAQVFDWVRTGTRTEFKFHNFYAYKKTLVQPYTNFLTRVYKTINHNYISSTNTNDNEFYGGDTLISPTTTFRLSPLLLVDENDSYAFTMMYRHHYEEHDINGGLRHLGTANTSKYFQLNDQDSYNFDRLTFLDDSGNRQRVDYENVIPEYYAYNPDFSLRFYEKAKVSLPIQFNYCSGCSGSYPNRIIFSPKSFDEEAFDLYRINKINDYIDIPAHRGAITGLKYQNNQLLVHTEDTTFILQPNPQQISTDQNTAYLTTGDFLSIPPQELLQTDTGTGGLQSKQSMCNTPFGHCWVDQKRGEVFNWNGKIDILSNDGLLQWSKENIPSELLKEYHRVYNEDFPIESTLTLNGRGIILYYDPRFKRLLITKRDYFPLDLKSTLTPGDTNAVIWNGTQWQAQPVSDIISVFPTDPQYFENKSWTLSYGFLDQGWTSWHSYIPWNAFSDSNNFYTTTLNHSVWKHLSKTNYQTYYTSKFNFIIEWMNSDSISSSVSNLYYVGYSQIWDPTNKLFKTVDTTFDKAMIYNFEQSSGLQNLILDTQNGASPYGNNSLASGSKYVIKTDQTYKIAGIYDMAINQPVITKDWSQKQLFSGYIDVVPNTPNINFNKSQYDWGNIWDKFVFVRLFYKPVADHRKSVLLQVLNNHQSIR